MVAFTEKFHNGTLLPLKLSASRAKNALLLLPTYTVPCMRVARRPTNSTDWAQTATVTATTTALLSKNNGSAGICADDRAPV
jgi:hypothetical protein